MRLLLLMVTTALLGCAGGPPSGPARDGASSRALLPPSPAALLERSLRETTGQDSPPLPELMSAEIGMHLDDTIFTTSARTVDFNGQSLVPRFTFIRATGLYDGNDHVGDPLDRELSVFRTDLRGVIGLDPDVTLSLNIPYVSRELRTRIGGARVRLNASGLGDVTLMGKWRYFKDQGLGESTELAAFGGIKVPTGRDDVHDGGLRLPQPLQPGSGSVDGILGVAVSRLWDGGRWLINADVFYKINSEANNYQFGNSLRFDVGGQFRFYPSRYESFDQTTWNLLLELNGSWAEKDEFAGNRINGTGGLKLFISPGVQVIVTDSLLFELGVQIPIFRDLNGPQLAEDLRATLGMRWRF